MHVKVCRKLLYGLYSQTTTKAFCGRRTALAIIIYLNVAEIFSNRQTCAARADACSRRNEKISFWKPRSAAERWKQRVCFKAYLYQCKSYVRHTQCTCAFLLKKSRAHFSVRCSVIAAARTMRHLPLLDLIIHLHAPVLDNNKRFTVARGVQEEMSCAPFYITRRDSRGVLSRRREWEIRLLVVGSLGKWMLPRRALRSLREAALQSGVKYDLMG